MISDKNTVTPIILSKDDKKKLKELAEAENRSLSNYIVNILKKHLEDK